MTDRQPREGLSSEMIVAPGARAAERALLADIVATLRRGAAAPHEPPLRVIVPSEALRLHVGARLAGAAGGALAGVEIQTLSRFAREVLEAAGEAPLDLPRALFEIWVRRQAAESLSLQQILATQPDASRTIAESISDLLDAGLDAGVVEALDVPALREGHAASRRAASLVHVAGKIRALIDGFFDAGGGRDQQPAYARHGDRLSRGAAHLRRDDFLAPPARALVLHGFPDLVGVGRDFVEALRARYTLRVYLDSPPACDAAKGESRETYTAPLRTGLGLAQRSIEAMPTGAPRFVEASSPEAEVRALCERLRDEIDAGRAPGEIGVVMREPARYAASLRRHLERLGIPYSAAGLVAPSSLTLRRAAALVDLVRERFECPCERWLDAVTTKASLDVTFELRHGLRVLGTGRLGALAGLDLHQVLGGATSLELGIPAAPDDEGGRVSSRRLERAALAAARDDAAMTLDALRAIEGRAPATDTLAALRHLLHEVLGWHEDDDTCREFLERLAALEGELPRDETLDAAELALLVERLVEKTAERSLTSSNPGVRVSDVLEARGQTYESLHVLGLVRDVFPRRISEDPLFLDDTRTSLAHRRIEGAARAVLPDLPIKSRGYEEERYLFDMLLAAGDEVTLSWYSHDESGKEVARSAFLSRIPGIAAEGAIETVSSLHDLSGTGSWSRPRSAFELALAVGLDRRTDELAPYLEAALDEAATRLGSRSGRWPRARLAAAALLDTIVELDDAFSASLGPFLGLVGAGAGALLHADPTHVTRLEGLVRCPWQYFLGRALGLAPSPDPLSELPGADARFLGSVIHRVLQRVTLDALPSSGPMTLDDTLDADAHAVEVPSHAKLERLAREAMHELALEEGVALGHRGDFFLELCMEILPRAFDRAGPFDAVLGAEVSGSWTTDSGRRVRFRADRVDRTEEGELTLIDYKTGTSVLSDAKTPATVEKHLLKKIAEGASIQGALYALATPDASGSGVYAYVDPEASSHKPRLQIAGEAPGLRDEAQRVIDVALEAWSEGQIPPRLVNLAKGEESDACRWCPLRDACVQGDSGARRRLLHWGESDASQHSSGRALWRISIDGPGAAR